MSTDSVTAEASGERPTVSQDPSAPVTEGGGDYAFGTERDEMATAIEAAFAARNATARWDGDVLVPSLDGDADEDMAAFSECRVLTQLLNEDDGAMVEFPNGKVDCADALAED
ncbi:MAG: hypothetical protein ABIS84_11435 [Arachnia sp.]